MVASSTASEEQDHVRGEGELILLGPVVVRGNVVGSLVSKFRAEENRRSHPVAPAKQMLRVLRPKPRPLASHIVEVLVADREVVVLRELILEVVNDRPFGSEAPH